MLQDMLQRKEASHCECFLDYPSPLCVLVVKKTAPRELTHE